MKLLRDNEDPTEKASQTERVLPKRGNPKTERDDPSLAIALIAKELPKWTEANMERVEPSRDMDLNDSVAPRLLTSKTDRDAPRRANPRSAKELPR
jgi:hypothetical protein